MVVTNCDYCDREFKVKPYKLKQKNVFCCHKCYGKWRSENLREENNPGFSKIKYHCDNCGKEFLLHPYILRELEEGIRKNIFCGKKCHHDFMKKKIKKICEVCRKEYEVPRTFKDSRFCSKKCYGKWYHQIYSKRPEVIKRKRKEGIKSLNSQKRKDTKPELMVREYLTENDIEFNPQRLFYNKYFVDFYLPKFDIIIEVQGDYWHANPEKFGDSEGKKPLTKKQKDRVKKDKVRYDDLVSHGHNVYFVWEKDIYEDINNALSFLNSANISQM